MPTLNDALARVENDVNSSRPAAQVMTQPPLAWPDQGVQRASAISAYVEVLFIHKYLILFCTLVSLLLGWAAILVWPRAYESTAKLMIRVGRESVSLDPTATTSATVMLQKTLEEEVISALEVLNSRQVAETVVDTLGAEAVLDGALPSESAAERSTYQETVESVQRAVSDSLYRVLKNAGIKDPVSDRELAVRKVQLSINIHSPKKSSVIIIEAEAETPGMAQAIVSAVTSSFLDEHSKAAHTKGSSDFFEKQSADVEAQLNELVARRSQFMKERNLVSIDVNRGLLQQQFSEINRDLAVAAGDLKQARSEMAGLKGQIAGTDADIVATKTKASDPTWSGMRQQVYELEVEEQRIAAQFTENHPKLKQVRDQLKGARLILAKLSRERVDESTTPNPTMVKLREELLAQQTRVLALETAIEEHKQRREELIRLTNELLEDERELTEADRNIKMAEANLEMLREKLVEARVSDELHLKGISNVHVFQPAKFVERAVSPKKPLVAAGFLVLGMITGLGLSALRQATSPFLRTKDDVELQLGVSVISSIPQFSRMDSLRLRDQKLYRDACQALISEILLSPGRPRQTQGRSIAVIGVNSDAGASTLAANLAVTGSVDCQMKTVLVDADSRQRTVSKMFGLNGTPGLVELVSGSASHDECLQRAKNAPINLVASAADSCNDLLTANASEIAQALTAYQQDCDLLIVDLPAAGQPDQAVALAHHLDCVLVVVESEKTQVVVAERLLRRLSESNAEIIGVVLNKTRSYLPKLIQKFVAPLA